MIYTDNPDFYPTPEPLLRQLLGSTRNISGRILEPSAGKGDIIKYIERMNCVENRIDAIENDPRLVSALHGAGYNVVWDDFLTYETFKEYDFIVMNPPFSNGVDHVLKALDLAESQLGHCAVFAILNKQTLDNAYSTKRQELLRRLDGHGAKIRYVSEAFMQAERRTDVEVALIEVSVEPADKGADIYESLVNGFVGDANNDDSELSTALSTFVKENEISAKMDDIERLVVEYETACELTKQAFEATLKKRQFFRYINEANKREGEVGGALYHIEGAGEYRAEDMGDELDRLRSAYWELILDTRDFREVLTSEGRQRLNRQIEAAGAMEINYANIKTLLMAIRANADEMLVDSIVSIFEKVTRYHMNEYSTNVHYYDGWKTNDAYRINHKIIIPIAQAFEHYDIQGWSGECNYDKIAFRAREWIDDIVRALKLIDSDFDDEFSWAGNNTYENEALRFRMFYNGNIHVWFRRKDMLDKLNYLCGQHFAWIPSEGEQERNAEARRWVAEEFGDIGEVALLQA